jgi:hypothetical protein
MVCRVSNTMATSSRKDPMTSLKTSKHPGQEPADLAKAFVELAEQWRRDTAHFSSITQKAMHPAYQRVIGMGPPVLPLIFQELERRPGHWFWALRAITGEDPVRTEDVGNIPKMTEAWLAFGKERGYL